MFKADDRQGIERHRGYAKALQEYGVFYDPDRIIWFHTEDRAVKPFARLRAMAASGIKLQSRQFRHCLSLDFAYQKTSP